MHASRVAPYVMKREGRSDCFGFCRIHGRAEKTQAASTGAEKPRRATEAFPLKHAPPCSNAEGWPGKGSEAEAALSFQDHPVRRRLRSFPKSFSRKKRSGCHKKNIFFV